MVCVAVVAATVVVVLVAFAMVEIWFTAVMDSVCEVLVTVAVSRSR
jgi:hypothetical protein